MARKPAETVQVNLRIKEGMRRQLEREAHAHRVSLNKEMLLRLEESFEKTAKRELDGIASDMAAVWARYGKRFLLLGLEDDLAKALAKTKDPEIANLAAAWLKTRSLKERDEEA
jgi:hypothetical protein